MEGWLKAWREGVAQKLSDASLNILGLVLEMELSQKVQAVCGDKNESLRELLREVDNELTIRKATTDAHWSEYDRLHA